MPAAATAPSTGTARLAARGESTSSKSGTGSSSRSCSGPSGQSPPLAATSDALDRERADRDAEQRVAPAGDGARPYVGDRAQEPHGDAGVRGAERQCGRPMRAVSCDRHGRDRRCQPRRSPPSVALTPRPTAKYGLRAGARGGSVGRMSSIHHDDARDTATLTSLDREWLRRQGRAARLLEDRQRTAVRDRRLPRRSGVRGALGAQRPRRRRRARRPDRRRNRFGITTPSRRGGFDTLELPPGEEAAEAGRRQRGGDRARRGPQAPVLLLDGGPHALVDVLRRVDRDGRQERDARCAAASGSGRARDATCQGSPSGRSARRSRAPAVRPRGGASRAHRARRRACPRGT